MILGIDASTPGSGGGKRHLIELLKCFQPVKHGFSLVKIWGVQKTLSQIPDSANIEKLSHPFLNKGFFYRVIWQIFFRDSAFKNQFDVLFSPFGTYSGKIRPYVSMSRNMLVFDQKERKRFGISLIRLKLRILIYKQKQSFKNAQGIIFLSQYAKSQVGKGVDISQKNTQIIHHGVSESFQKLPSEQKPISYYTANNPFKFLYLSPVWVYKHQVNVLEAVVRLRNKKYPVSINFVGSIQQKREGKKLAEAIAKYDPDAKFVTWFKTVKLDGVQAHYKTADTFVFASTCENMPNILIEAMSSGLPIACSSYDPMPEFLKDGGLYFDPTNTTEIESVLETLLTDHNLRSQLSIYSFKYSENYKWQKCADETFSFLQKIATKSLSNVQQ